VFIINKLEVTPPLEISACRECGKINIYEFTVDDMLFAAGVDEIEFERGQSLDEIKEDKALSESAKFLAEIEV
jgi:hypothetical protein